jgi:hypothetical protein
VGRSLTRPIAVIRDRPEGVPWRTEETAVNGLVRPSRPRESIKRLCKLGRRKAVVAASRLWEPDNELRRVLGQCRDTPDNEEWSWRWESNPHGRRFRD